MSRPPRRRPPFFARARALLAGHPTDLAPEAGAVLDAAEATETDAEMMTRALDLARRAGDRGEVPVGAVVYETSTGRVLGEGANAREADHDPTAHAELIAIRAAARALGDWRLNPCTLVVTLEPCPMCAGLMVNARLGRVVYGADDPKAGACRTLFKIGLDPRLNHRCTIIGGVEAEQSAELLTSFFRSRRGRRGRDRDA